MSSNATMLLPQQQQKCLSVVPPCQQMPWYVAAVFMEITGKEEKRHKGCVEAGGRERGGKHAMPPSESGGGAGTRRR